MRANPGGAWRKRLASISSHDPGGRSGDEARLPGLAAAALVFSTTLGVTPVGAQGRSEGCVQNATGGGSATGAPLVNTNPSDSRDTLVGVIHVAVSDVQALNNIEATLNALNGDNVSMVCLNDAINQNDVRVLQDVLNGSPVLNNDLNNTLRNSTFLNDVLNHNDIALLNNVQVVAIDLGSGQVFLLKNA